MVFIFSKDDIECGKFELKYNDTLDQLTPVQRSALGHYEYIGTSNKTILRGTGNSVFVLQKTNDMNKSRTGIIHNYQEGGWIGSVIFNVILGTFTDVGIISIYPTFQQAELL